MSRVCSNYRLAFDPEYDDAIYMWDNEKRYNFRKLGSYIIRNANGFKVGSLENFIIRNANGFRVGSLSPNYFNQKIYYTS